MTLHQHCGPSTSPTSRQASHRIRSLRRRRLMNGIISDMLMYSEVSWLTFGVLFYCRRMRFM
ncbi:hypothetical protein Hanom_Chr08g00694991 [Helianthus anomalus]